MAQTDLSKLHNTLWNCLFWEAQESRRCGQLENARLALKRAAMFRRGEVL